MTTAHKEAIVHLGNYLDLLRQGRLGFSVDEEMSGTHEFEPGSGRPPGRLPLVFRVRWSTRDMLDWVNRRGKELPIQELEGTITVGGLCKDAPCRGTLKLMYFTEQKIRYTIFFEADGQQYRYVGEKVNIRPWNLPISHTTCFGIVSLVRGGRLISRSVTHFHMNTAWKFATSVRLVPHP